ncbi:DUF6922 domain-containing protein [Flavihumibacter sp. UBA7668]
MFWDVEFDNIDYDAKSNFINERVLIPWLPRSY